MNLRRLIPVVALLGLTLAALPESAQASVIAATFTNNGSPGTRQFGPQTMGWEFTLTSTISVTELGFYDDGLNGLVESHAVGIWQQVNPTTGILLTSGVVSTGNTLTNQFRYVPIAPTILGPGTYVIGAEYKLSSQTNPLGDPYLASAGIQSGTFATGAGIAYVKDRYSATGGLVFPTLFVAGNFDPAIFGPNFKYDPVPEPASLGLVLLGIAGFAIRRRR